MYNLIKLSILSFIGMGLLACEKVIEVDLETAEVQLVIEANLQAGEHPFSVLISRTAPYFTSGEVSAVAVADATITLSDNTGNVFEIPETNTGVYELPVEGVAGKTYTLTVEVDNTTYTATSFLPPTVELTEVYTEFRAAMGPNDAGYLVFFRYQDPAETENFYRARHYINGVLQNEGDDLQVVNDELNNGSEARFPLFQQIFQPEDTVVVELIHFDENCYEYFNSLSDIIGGGRGFAGGSAAPGNPTTNWSGGALGYFCAYSADRAEILVTE